MALFESILTAATALMIPAPRRAVPHLRVVPKLPEPDIQPDTPDVSEPETGHVLTEPDTSFWETGKPVSVREFARWLRETEDIPHEMTRRQLMTHMVEFCDYSERKPVSERAMLKKLKKYGVTSRRGPTKIVNGKQERLTVYRVRPVQRCRRAA